MDTFYVSFGSQYGTVPHPTVPMIHPDGVMEVKANDYETARSIVVAAIGATWSNMYDADDMEWKYFPRQVTHRIVNGNIEVLV